MRKITAALVLVLLITLVITWVREEVPLIPRLLLFASPGRSRPLLSPDGTWLSFRAAHEGKVNVWVAPAGDWRAARPVTSDTTEGVHRYFWAYTNDHLLYLQDRAGDENWRLYSVDVSSLERRALTPPEGVRAEIQELSPEFPSQLLVRLNDRVPELHDIHRVDLATGERQLVMENPGELGGGSVTGFLTDPWFRVRFARIMLPDGGVRLMQPGPDSTWEEFETIPAEDVLTTRLRTFDATGRTAYWTDSRGCNTAALFSHDLETGERHLLAEDPLADAGHLLVHPTRRTVEAVSFNYDRPRWEILDESIRGHLERLAEVDDGDLYVTSRTLADDNWIILYERDDTPGLYYTYDPGERKATFLFHRVPALEGHPLTRMHTRIIRSRDDLELVSYLSLPPWSDPDGDGRPREPLPMILLVHGGPWSRDTWGYNSRHQWLANRGYAVLSVNFRGSTGFGKAFANAGTRQWGRRMQDDLLDGVEWAVGTGVARRGQVGIMGGSYGGYATLAGLTLTPEVFACGVDMVGPSNLITMLETFPPYWKPWFDLYTSRIGDPRTEKGRAMLNERSPLTHADRIVRPLLIAHGTNDPRVDQDESDQMVQAMQANGIPVTYLQFPDEGHSLDRAVNRLAFGAVAEAFLAEHLGGRKEPFERAFQNSSIHVPAGEELVPGLAEILEFFRQSSADSSAMAPPDSMAPDHPGRMGRAISCARPWNCWRSWRSAP